MNVDLAIRMANTLGPLVAELTPLIVQNQLLTRRFRRTIKPNGWEGHADVVPDWSRTAAQMTQLPIEAIDAASARLVLVPELRAFLQGTRASPPHTDDQLPGLARFVLVTPILIAVFRTGPEFAQATVGSVCALAARQILEHQQPVSYVIPLVGLRLPGRQTVAVDDEVSIAYLPAETIDEIVNDYVSFEAEREIFDVEAAIVVNRMEPTEGPLPSRQLTEDIKLLLTLLQLEMNYPVRGLGMITKRGSPLTHFSAGVSVWREVGIGPLAILADESMLRSVAALWPRVRAPGLREQLALSRWRSAMRAEHPGDRLIDLWIALESLFGAGGKTELRYRMSLRIPLFAGQGGERRRLAKIVKQSYDLRSSLVHGSAHHERLSSDKVALIDETQIIARAALLRLIREGPFDAEEMEERFLDEVAAVVAGAPR